MLSTFLYGKTKIHKKLHTVKMLCMWHTHKVFPWFYFTDEFRGLLVGELFAWTLKWPKKNWNSTLSNHIKLLNYPYSCEKHTHNCKISYLQNMPGCFLLNQHYANIVNSVKYAHLEIKDFEDYTSSVCLYFIFLVRLKLRITVQKLLLQWKKKKCSKCR